MSNSPLVSYTKISPNSSNPRNKPISKITIHHMAGNLSVETCGSVFSSSVRQASSNYGIGSDGRVGMYVEEKNRSWASSSPANDHQAVTIEVANSQVGGQWPVSERAFARLIDLCVDICKRNRIKKLEYTGDSRGNLTMHKMFANTACPGPYLESRFKFIAEEVNKHLNNEEDDEMATIIERIAKEAGLSVDSTIKALGVLAKFANTSEETWEKDGAKKLIDRKLISTPRDGREIVEFGELGVVLDNLIKTYCK